MLHILAAVASMAAALAELALGAHINVNSATPHLVLVLGVIWTTIAGIDDGLVWAFVGGITIDVLAQRPLGSSAFALIVSLGIAAAIANLFGRARLIAPVVATLVCSLTYSMLLYVSDVALQGPVGIVDPLPTFLPGAIADTILAVIIGPLVVSVVMKHREAERVEW